MASKAVLETVNEQQETFCQDYAVRLSVIKAAENAGYAREYGYQLLKLPHIIDRIAEIQRHAGVKMIVSQGKVIREAAYLAYSDITDTLGVNTVEGLKALPENVRRAIQSIKITKTPIVTGGKVDRRSQRTTELLEHGAESAETCHKVTDGVLYEETIEIKMHPKMEAIKLLALITRAVTNPEDDQKLLKPAFTGMDLKVVDKQKSGKNVSKEQKDDE